MLKSPPLGPNWLRTNPPHGWDDFDTRRANCHAAMHNAVLAGILGQGFRAAYWVESAEYWVQSALNIDVHAVDVNTTAGEIDAFELYAFCNPRFSRCGMCQNLAHVERLLSGFCRACYLEEKGS